MTTLVTGGAGFIGSHVAKHCMALGQEVVVLDDLSGGFVENVPQKAIFVKGSITDADLIAKLFSEHRFDYVYHLAAYAAEGLSHFIRRFNYNNNLIGSINLINESVKHEIKCFVFTSSIAVYGVGQVPITEDQIPVPEDPYGVAKYAVEMDLRCAHEMFGLDYIIFRPHNVYGEHQNIGDRYRNVIGIFMNQVMKNEPMTIFGNGEQTRAFSYIDDVAPQIARSVNINEAINQVFNVGADKPYTVLEVADAVAQSFNVKPNLNYLPARNEVLHAFSSHEKAHNILGNDTQTTLKDGVNQMAQWAKNVGAQQTSLFSGVEIKKNMPPSWLKALKEEKKEGENAIKY